MNLETLLDIIELALFNVCVCLCVKFYVFTVHIINFQASMGNGSISFCGMSMDWNDVLADYEGTFSYITVFNLKCQQNLEKCLFYLCLCNLEDAPNI